MTYVTQHPADGTPTWLDLMIPDLDRAMAFYGGVFGWTFEVGPPEVGRYTFCRLDGRAVAALMPHFYPEETEFAWWVYFATADLDATLERVLTAGGEVINDPIDLEVFGRVAVVHDAGGALFGLWEGRDHVGCEVVNEPGSLVRNDLVTPDSATAKEFYPRVFDYTLDGNDDWPDGDFVFLRRPDGHEIGGIAGDPAADRAQWGTCFEVADTDATVATVLELGGRVTSPPEDFLYGRLASVEDPFGTPFSLIARPTAG